MWAVATSQRAITQPRPQACKRPADGWRDQAHGLIIVNSNSRSLPAVHSLCVQAGVAAVALHGCVGRCGRGSAGCELRQRCCADGAALPPQRDAALTADVHGCMQGAVRADVHAVDAARRARSVDGCMRTRRTLRNLQEGRFSAMVSTCASERCMQRLPRCCTGALRTARTCMGRCRPCAGNPSLLSPGSAPAD